MMSCSGVKAGGRSRKEGRTDGHLELCLASSVTVRSDGALHF